MKKKVRKAGKLDRLLEMPVEVASDEPKITILGFNQTLIENYKGILEYEDYYIKINSYLGIININGYHLNLNQMTEDDILITGRIDSISLESATDDEEEEKA